MRHSMNTEFKQLNRGWNAEPNAPEETVSFSDNMLSLTFFVNPWAYEGYIEGQRAELKFKGCSKWRLGSTNDEGWYKGLCRFGKLAHRWGEFYEVGGETLDHLTDDWRFTGLPQGRSRFLFYLRDSTFECQADSYEYYPKTST